MDVRLYNGIFIVTTESLILQDEEGEKSFISLLLCSNLMMKRWCVA
jgi:hypothetical protein